MMTIEVDGLAALDAALAQFPWGQRRPCGRDAG